MTQPLTIKQMLEWMKNMPFNSLIGIRPVRGHKDGLTIECKVRKELLNTAGVLHGGVTATMADAANQIIQSDIDLYGGAHVSVLVTKS